MTEVIANRIDFSVPPVTTAIGSLRDGKLRPLGVMSAKRISSLPDAPTMIEAGLTNDAIYPFYTGAYLPSKTPRAIVDKLHSEVTKALAVPAVQERLKGIGVEPLPMTQAEFQAFFKKDIDANLELVKAANIPTQ